MLVVVVEVIGVLYPLEGGLVFLDVIVRVREVEVVGVKTVDKLVHKALLSLILCCKYIVKNKTVI